MTKPDGTPPVTDVLPKEDTGVDPRPIFMERFRHLLKTEDNSPVTEVQSNLLDTEAANILAKVIVDHLLLTAEAKQRAQSVMEEGTRKIMEGTLPWTKFLPAEERSKFAREFVEMVRTCASVGNNTALDKLVRAWKSTAIVHSDPKLAAELQRPLPGSDVVVPCP